MPFPRGGPERGNPAMTTKRLRQGEKETHNLMLWEKEIVGQRDKNKSQSGLHNRPTDKKTWILYAEYSKYNNKHPLSSLV